MAVKGYRCVFTTTDKQSKEKIDALKAFGAEVIVCPTDVDLKIRGRTTRCRRAGARDPCAWKANHTTTRRTPKRTTSRPRPRSGIRPTARSRTSWSAWHRRHGQRHRQYLKERNPKIKVWGIDTYGSVFKK